MRRLRFRNTTNRGCAAPRLASRMAGPVRETGSTARLQFRNGNARPRQAVQRGLPPSSADDGPPANRRGNPEVRTMCLTCGCGQAHKRMGNNITYEDVRDVAQENNKSV